MTMQTARRLKRTLALQNFHGMSLPGKSEHDLISGHLFVNKQITRYLIRCDRRKAKPGLFWIQSKCGLESTLASRINLNDWKGDGLQKLWANNVGNGFVHAATIWNMLEEISLGTGNRIRLGKLYRSVEVGYCLPRRVILQNQNPSGGYLFSTKARKISSRPELEHFLLGTKKRRLQNR